MLSTELRDQQMMNAHLLCTGKKILHIPIKKTFDIYKWNIYKIRKKIFSKKKMMYKMIYLLDIINKKDGVLCLKKR